MNPALLRPLGANSLRQAATLSLKAAFPSQRTNTFSQGMRLYSASRSACTNSVRKTLYSHNSLHHQSRLQTLHPSSSLSRFSPVIRRGFADKAGSTPTSTTTGGTVAKKAGFMDKIKQLIKQYGYTGVAVYLGISCLDLAATFIVVKAAGMDKIEIAQEWVVKNIGAYFGYKGKQGSDEAKTIPETGSADLDKVDDEQVGAIYNKASSLWSVFVIAYGIHKLLVPLRVVATSMITPPLVKWLVKKGWIKAIPKAGSAAATTAAATSATTKP